MILCILIEGNVVGEWNYVPGWYTNICDSGRSPRPNGSCLDQLPTPFESQYNFIKLHNIDATWNIENSRSQILLLYRYYAASKSCIETHMESEVSPCNSRCAGVTARSRKCWYIGLVHNFTHPLHFLQWECTGSSFQLLKLLSHSYLVFLLQLIHNR